MAFSFPAVKSITTKPHRSRVLSRLIQLLTQLLIQPQLQISIQFMIQPPFQIPIQIHLQSLRTPLAPGDVDVKLAGRRQESSDLLAARQDWFPFPFRKFGLFPFLLRPNTI